MGPGAPRLPLSQVGGKAIPADSWPPGRTHPPRFSDATLDKRPGILQDEAEGERAGGRKSRGKERLLGFCPSLLTGISYHFQSQRYLFTVPGSLLTPWKLPLAT